MELMTGIFSPVVIRIGRCRLEKYAVPLALVALRFCFLDLLQIPGQVCILFAIE